MGLREDSEILHYCKDLHDWPRRWMIEEVDLKCGELLLKELKPFIKYLISSDLRKTTIRKHINNLWLLGGELISSLQWDESLRKLDPADLISSAVGDDGGPYSRHLSTENERVSFDATCRKLHKFLQGHKA